MLFKTAVAMHLRTTLLRFIRPLTQYHRGLLYHIQYRCYSDEHQHIVQSPCPSITIPTLSLTDFVWQHMRNWEDKICMECGLTGRRYTYAQARDGSRRFAVSLQRLGLCQGDVVAVVLPNMPEYPLVILGAVEAGLVVTTVNPAYTAGEISKQFKASGTRCVVTDSDHYGIVLEATKLNGPSPPPIIIVGTTQVPLGAIDFREMIREDVEVSGLSLSNPIDPEALVVLPYSSGTTGLPKGVMLSHRNLIANILQFGAEPFNLTLPTTRDHQDILPAVLPFFHIYGLTVLLLSKLFLGSKIVTIPKFDPTVFINIIINHKASILYLAPPLVLFLASHPQIRPELLVSVRHIMSGAAPLGQADVERLLSKAPPGMDILQGYGLTETSPVLMHLRKGSSNVGSVGPPIPSTTAKVVDIGTGSSLGPDQIGEVCIKGPQVMLGYLNNPKATSDMIDEDGWLHTGDIGHYDDQHDFYIVDRVKELIKVKGFQVPPAELEELLRTHPHVADAAVIGVPDSRAGELPHAFIVLKQTASITDTDIADFVASRVAPHKQLAGGMTFVAKIPKNASGKILRRQLRDAIL